MIKLLSQIPRPSHTHFLLTETDVTSLPRLPPSLLKNATVHTLPRAREVHQSYISSIPTTLNSLLKTLHLLTTLSPPPTLLLTNGPSNAVPLILAYHLLNLLLPRPRIIYVESWCRVTSLSMTGKILKKVRGCDWFVAHWEGVGGTGVTVIENLFMG